MKFILPMICTFGLCGAVLADTATYFPSADTTISQNDFTQTAGVPANGSSGTMIVGHLNPANGNVPVRGLLRFDITNLPPNVVVTSATLRVTVASISAGATTDSHSLHRLSLWWDEATALWLNTGWEPWENAGGDYEANPDGTVVISGPATYTFASTSGLIDAVQMWATNAPSNFGWVLRSAGEDDGHNARRFTTREAGADRPTLEVSYTLPPPPVDPVTLLNPRLGTGTFVFDFAALPGATYTVQYKGSVESTNWNSFHSVPAPGSPTVITVQDPLTTTNRFYRVVSP
jgi:hypothetical protein